MGTVPSLAERVTSMAMESWSNAALLALAGLEYIDPSLASSLRARKPRDLREIAEAVQEHAPVRARVQRHDAEEIFMLAGSGASVLVPTDGGWLTASRKKSTFVRGTARRRITLSRDTIASFTKGDALPCVVIEPRLPLGSLSVDRVNSDSPWARLRALMALERSELWVLVMFAFAIGALNLALPVAVQVLVNTIAFGTLLQPLLILAVLLFAGLALMGAVQLAEWYTVEVLQRRLFVRISEDLSRRFAALPAEARERWDLSKLANHFFEVVNLQKSMNKLLLDGLALALQTLVAVFLLAVYHPALLAFDLMLIAGIVTLFWLGRGGVESAILESKTKYEVGGWISGLAIRKGVAPNRAREDAVAQRTEILTRGWMDARKLHFRHLMRILAGGVVLQIFAMTALLGLGGSLVMAGEMTLGQLVAAEFVVGMLAAGIVKIGKHIESGFDLLAGLDKLGKVLDLPTIEAHRAPLPYDNKPQLEVANLQLERRNWRGAQPLSFTLGPKTRLLLDGDEASGKTTLLETLAGIRTPNQGDLRWCETHSLREAMAQLRAEAYLVGADDLVPGTVLDNLRMIDATLEREAAWPLLRRVGLLERIESLDEGLDAYLPAVGGPLSVSERARLSIACAILAGPSLLLIDGALDTLSFDESAREPLLDQLLGIDAPWAAVVASRHPVVRRRCNQRLSLSDAGGAA